MTRWLRRFWIWLNTAPIEVIAPQMELEDKLDRLSLDAICRMERK